jgi:serine/threonine-protein kinase
MTVPPTLTPERWDRVQQIFHQALERNDAHRGSFVEDVCGDDLELRGAVASLLEAHERGGMVAPLEDDRLIPLAPGHIERLKAALADRYAIERPLGAGGMATVYLAEDLRHGRKVALKILHPDFSASLGVERFLREIKIAAVLRHPHILPLYDSGEADGSLYYVMPVEGESLRHRLNRDSTVPIDEALHIVREVLDALDYAHGEGVVHRDIKPDNILCSLGHATLADFGIARAISAAGGERITLVGMAIGTPAYMSPEQLAGDPGLDGRSDLYGVGCVLYEMLLGDVLVPGRSAESLEALVTAVQLSPRVERAIRTAMALDRRDRFATASEFAEALTSQSLWRGKGSTSAGQSVAVLPFANMSTDPENEYFSDGITEEIINSLAQIQGLHVAARTSSFVFKGKTLDITDVGAKLRVATVLEGSVRKSGNRLRITAQLINVADGYHLWSERYDREIDDVFAIQDEIARTIADRLKVALSGLATDEPLVKAATKDMRAYQLYLKGRHLWNRRTKASLEQAVEYFQEAIGRDVEYASAHAGLADAYILLGSYTHMPLREAYGKAKEAVERALELDRTLAEAHASHGQILRWQRDWLGEEAAYRRAIELNPGYATAHQWYATLLAALGRPEEALQEIHLAEELDPLSHAISVTAVVVLYAARQYDTALEQLNRVLELEPNFASVHAWFGVIHAEQGRYQEAIDAIDRAFELNPDNLNQLFGLAYAYARMGEREKAVEVVNRAREGGVRGWLGMIWATLGDMDSAFECMEEALHEGESWDAMFYVRTFPPWDPLRSDPRYHEFLRRMNFPVTGA